jgi:hypothetical protein
MRKWISLLFIFTSLHVSAYVDFNLNYSFSQNIVDGVENSKIEDTKNDPGRARSITKTYSAVWAWYIWEYTALEFNYTHSENEVIDERSNISADQTLIINKVKSDVITTVQGVGIRQAFAGRNATLLPSLSIGYAQMTINGTSIYTITNNDVRETIKVDQATQRINSGYVAFSLRYRMTELMGISLGAKTVIPEMDMSKAQNNMTYFAGFSWIF